MKRFITLYTLTCMFFLSLHAQEVKLTIENTAGGLKDAMTEEQKQTVTDLTLTGSMDDKDFYLIRDGMPELKYLDMKCVEVDTVPKKAFYNKSIEKLFLPQNVKYLADNSFQEAYGILIISGKFPKLGENVFYHSYQIELSESNLDCRKIGRNIHSFDGKILFLYRTRDPLLVTIPDGTETIASRAFDNASICGLKFPASLKKIEEHAFTNATKNGYTRVWGEDETLYCFYFKSVLPPVLEGDVFNAKASWFNSFFIRVPIGSKQYYTEANEQWSIFDRIEEYDFNPLNISSTENHLLKTEKKGNTLFLTSESKILRIEVFSPQGCILYSTTCNDTMVNVPLQSGVNLIKVTFKDKSPEVIKILNE